MPAPVLPAEPVVAVVGATGLVGEVLLAVLQERRFPLSELRLLASSGSVGRAVTFAGREVLVGEASAAALRGADLVFFAASAELSRALGPGAARNGALVVDKSSTWRLDPAVPLVVPEVNPGALAEGGRLVACPNCTTIGLVLALAPLHRAAGLEQVVVTTFQAASGAGRAALDALERQEVAARTVLPLCETLEADGTSTEERKLLLETRKLLDEPELSLAATCVRVPVPVGHAASVWVRTRRRLAPEEARAVLAQAPGVELVELPTPLGVAGTDACQVGRVRTALTGDELQFFQAADNLRKGAATNAVQIAELCLPCPG